NYLLGLFPQPPGLTSLAVQVGDADVTGLELVLPPTRMVTGKIVVQNGPLPHALLEFSTLQGYIVGATINPDGTFSTRLQPARHCVDLAGMSVGYSIASVRVGSQDVSEALVVGNADVSGVIINVAAPRNLPRLRGRIVGLLTRSSSTKIEVNGPIIGGLETV